MRGILTEEILTKAAKLGLVNISVKELRLMPYIQNVMVNSQRLDPACINQMDRDILAKWRKAGYLEGGATGMTITYQFWNIINELMWIAYVNTQTFPNN